MRNITDKAVQVHYVCSCGFNSVYIDSYPIRWIDLAKSGIKRRICKKTGEKFLFWKDVYAGECDGDHFD